VVSVSVCGGGGLLLVGEARIMRWTETAACIGSGACASYHTSSRCRRLFTPPFFFFPLLYCSMPPPPSFWRVRLVVVC
jgi:hypothetical protein